MRLITAEQILVNGAFRPGYAVEIVGDTITWVGPLAERLGGDADAVLRPGGAPGLSIEDWGRVALVPGTVNAHNHSFQSLLRGIADDEPFFVWRDRALYRFAPLLGPEGVYTGALLAFGEMLGYGVTTVNDFFYIHDGGNENAEAVIQAAQDVGIRLVLTRTMYDWTGAPASFVETVPDAYRRTRQLMEKYASHPSVTVYPAPHSPHAASPEMIQAGWRLAEETGTYFHIHVAEGQYEVKQIRDKYGMRPIEWLESLGVLGPRLVIVHGVWLDDEDIRRLGGAGAGLAYNPASNMFLGDGITRLPEMLAAGVKVALGTDGGCSNNRTSIFDEMRTCGLLQKVARLDGAAIAAETAFRLGTAGGGEVLGLPIGRIAPGFKADLVALDLDDISLYPPHNLLKNIVYSMSPTAIRRVMVGGRVVWAEGELLTFPLARIRRLVETLTGGWREIIARDAEGVGSQA
ncbi:MAG: S-adenosylhomocysteine deaminase [Firmicutes bacterium ZCTH02-B6]|nr:MAG: S-adenosylhomocysteine deaminase [Firmicutes bacterium ZCTH02-B6]